MSTTTARLLTRPVFLYIWAALTMRPRRSLPGPDPRADAETPSDDITKYRRDLNKMLYDFDDYLVADSFDPEKYACLQALARDVVPRIKDLIELVLEAPIPDHAQLSPPLSPHSRSASPFRRPPSHVSLAHRPFLHAPPSVGSAPEAPHDMSPVDATEQLERLLHGRSLDDTPGSRRAASVLALGPPPSEQLPPAPAPSPWESSEPPSSSGGHSADLNPAHQARTRPESPVDPHIPHLGPKPRLHVSSLARRPAARCGRGSDCDAAPRRRLVDVPTSKMAAVFISTDVHSRQSTPVPEDDAVDIAMPLPQLPTAHSSPAPKLPRGGQLGRPRRTSAESATSSGDDSERSAPLSFQTGMSFEPLAKFDSLRSGPPTSPPPPGPPPPLPPSQGRKELPVRPPQIVVDSGLIVTEPVASGKKSLNNAPPPLKGPMFNTSDSFYLHKGFCTGAQEVLRGEIGVKKVQKAIR